MVACQSVALTKAGNRSIREWFVEEVTRGERKLSLEY
jgi:hypothetical protein